MIPALVLTIAAILYRVVMPFAANGSAFMNFAPIAAIALCGAIWLPKRTALLIPLFALLISDLFLNQFVYHVPLFSPEMVMRYFALAAVSGIGVFLRTRRSLLNLIGGSIAGSIIFYVVTNTASWMSEPLYAKSFTGWVQALTTGLPGMPPTWMFYRNTLASDLLYSLLFAGCMVLSSGSLGARKQVNKTADSTANVTA